MSTNLPPTRVLYVRNIPESVTDSDLIQYCSPFGRVTSTLILKEKGHGFIEFDTIEASTTACTYFNQNPLVLHGFHIEFTFSQRQEITPRKDPDANPPNRIILLTVTNIMYPVTVDVISQIFAKYGGLEKVIIFNRGNAIQALVQLRDIATASTCRAQLDGQNIYAGCNSLKVQYSSLPELEVKQNNERMFDFTQPAGYSRSGLFIGSMVPNGSTRSGYTFGGALSPMNGGTYQALGSFTGGGPSPKSFGSEYITGGSPVLLVENIDETLTIPEHFAALFAVYGNVIRIKMMRNLESALVQLGDLDQCQIAMEYLNGALLHNRPISVTLSKGGNIPPPSKIQEEGGGDSVRDFTGFPLLFSRHRPDKPQRLFTPSNTLHISNMPDGTSEEELIAVLVTVGGAEVEYMRFLDEQHHIAIVVCSSTENALQTLVICHAQLCGASSVAVLPRPLRIGFGHASDVSSADYVNSNEYYDEVVYAADEPVADVAPGFEHIVASGRSDAYN